MNRLTDRKTAEAVKANIRKLQAAGADVSIIDLRYVKLAEYENTEEDLISRSDHEEWYE